MKLKHYANNGGDIDSLELYFEVKTHILCDVLMGFMMELCYFIWV